MSARFWLPALASCLGALAGCGGTDSVRESEDDSSISRASERAAPETSEATVPGADSVFLDVSDATGLDFVHFNGMAGRFYYSEMMGSGGALFDADGDGDLDLFLVQGAELGAVAAAESQRPPVGSMLPLRDRLYLQEEPAEDATPRFHDATDPSGLDSRGYGMGAVAADFDGNGHEDLYVTNAGANELWLGRGDGTFELSSDEASQVAEWSVAAVPLERRRRTATSISSLPTTSNTRRPSTKLAPTPSGSATTVGRWPTHTARDVLLRNRGDGTFDDVSRLVGLGTSYGRALGAVAVDLDRDGQLEIFVANDGDENQLWHRRDGTQELALPRPGPALGRGGQRNGTTPRRRWALPWADADGNTLTDLFVSHLNRETNTLYLARELDDDAHGGFDDRSTESGLGAPSFDRTGFGTVFLDWDLDGDLDLLVANGAVKVIAEQSLAGDDYPLHQPNQLFRNLSGSATDPIRFEEVNGDPWEPRVRGQPRHPRRRSR